MVTNFAHEDFFGYILLNEDATLSIVPEDDRAPSIDGVQWRARNYTGHDIDILPYLARGIHNGAPTRFRVKFCDDLGWTPWVSEIVTTYAEHQAAYARGVAAAA